MTENKQKPTENPTGQNGKGPEGAKVEAPGMPDKGPEIATQKTDAKKEATRETSGIKREILQTEINPDKETVGKIEKLDAKGGLDTKEQKEGFEAMLSVTGASLLAMLFDQGLTKEALRKFENMKSIGEGYVTRLNPAERIALKKIQEICSNPKSVLFLKIKETWERMVDRSYEIYEAAKKAKESFEAQKTQPAVSVAGEPSEKPKGKEEPTTLWGKIKNTVSEHPYLAAVGVAAGAYGIYKIYKWFSSSDDEGKKEPGMIEKLIGDKWGKRIKYALGVGMGIFVLGRLIGNEDLGKWLKDKLNINLTGNRLSQFIMLLSEGKFVEAIKALFEGPDEHLDVHKRMAEKISKEMGTEIKPETLKKLGSLKYDDFISLVAQGKSAISELLGQIPGLSLITGDAADAEQEKVLRKYFENHKEEIEHFKNNTMTVDDILTNLDGAEKVEVPAEIQAINADIDKLPDDIKPAVQEIQNDMGKKLIPESIIKNVITQSKKIGIDTKKLEELLAEQKQAVTEYHEAIKKPETLQVIAEKAQKAFDVNEKLGEEKNSVENELMKRRGWTETELLAATHAPKFYRWIFVQPAWKKEYGKYIVSKYLKAPFAAGKEGIDAFKGTGTDGLIGKKFKPDASSVEIEADMKKTKTELDTAKADLDEAKKQQVTEIKTDTEVKAEINHRQSKVDLLEKDMEIQAARKKIADSEFKISELNGKGGAAGEIAQAEKIAEENRSILRTLTGERVKLQGAFLGHEIAETSATFVRELGTHGEKAVLSKGYIDQMDQIQASIDTHRKQILEQRQGLLDEAEKLAKDGKKDAIRPLSVEVNEMNKELVKMDMGALKNVDGLASSWFKSWNLYWQMRGGAVPTEMKKIMETEKNDIQRTFNKILTGQREAAKGSGLGVIHTMKGRFPIYGAFFALGSAINLADRREGESVTNDFAQAAVDTIPFVSTYSDFHAAAFGEEWMTKRKLDAKDRTVRALFAVGSGLCDATEFAGAFMRLRGMAGAYKEARLAGKTIEMAEAMRAMEKEGKVIDSIEALREMSQTGRWVHKLAFAGALGGMGYGFIYKPVADMQFSAETQQVLSGQIQDLDIEPPKIDHPLVN